MNTVSTSGLTSEIRTAIAAMRAQASRSTARTINADEAATIAADVRRALRATTPEDVSVLVTVRGGYVPNSYKYAAESDEVVIVVDLATGERTVRADRGRAQSRRNGRGDETVVRIRRAGQTQGRVL